jgi:succinate dehydrogenase assembly factor 2
VFFGAAMLRVMKGVTRGLMIGLGLTRGVMIRRGAIRYTSTRGIQDVAPIQRFNEDRSTLIKRLIYQSRKRGILETTIILSSFDLEPLTVTQLNEYDKLLDENDWDIYYWLTGDAPERIKSLSIYPLLVSHTRTMKQ